MPKSKEKSKIIKIEPKNAYEQPKVENEFIPNHPFSIGLFGGRGAGTSLYMRTFFLFSYLY